jgi:hypothetical protein
MRDLFEAFGMTFNENDNMTSSLPYDLPLELPENSPNGETVQQFSDEHYLVLLDGALANLDKIPASFKTILTAGETGDLAVEIDYGDVLMYKALLNANRLLVLIMSSYNLSIDIDAIINNDQLSINTDLLSDPELLNLLSVGEANLLSVGEANLGAAKAALLDASNNYLAASEFIRSESDPQHDDLISFDFEDREVVANEEFFRQKLDKIIFSLNNNSTAILAYKDENYSLNQLNLNPFFGYGNGPYNLRDLFPSFHQCDNPINGTMGNGLGNDATLGGILPEFSQGDWIFQFEDNDFDGVCDDVDNCPDICNSDQLDADNDNIGDVCDTTPGCGGISCGVPQPACEQECVGYPGDTYCTEYGPCSEGVGDCDSDSECESSLICVNDVGADYGWDSWVDVCEN